MYFYIKKHFKNNYYYTHKHILKPLYLINMIFFQLFFFFLKIFVFGRYLNISIKASFD
jgi:hypothetical protein